MTGPAGARHRVAIVGAGIGGMALAMGLLDDGIDDFVILERSDGVGGTWRLNTYPGAACDVPSHLYCYSFAPNPYWSRAYADQPEILAYLERCAEERGLGRHLRPNWPVARAAWSEADGTWTLTCEEGEHAGEQVVAEVAVFATGLFGEPRRPDIPGIGAFGGAIVHSARWDHGVGVEGRRVGVIGTGASATQIVPALAGAAGHTTVFQRTPAYILPRKDPEFSPEDHERFASDPVALAAVRAKLYEAFEGTTAFRRGDPTADLIRQIALEHLERAVPDPDLRARLTPDYALGCNRTLISSAYYPALMRDAVELVTEPITSVVPDGVRTADGRLHPLDVLVLATGFHAGEWLHGITVTGRAGRRLHDEWTPRARAYLGMAVTGFPNLFVFYGPNTNQGGNSIILILEAQAAYVRRVLARMSALRARALEVQQRALDRYDRELHAALADTVWVTGCRSYFTDADGRVVTQLPWTSAEYAARLHEPDLADYHVRPA